MYGYDTLRAVDQELITGFSFDYPVHNEYRYIIYFMDVQKVFGLDP